LDLIFVFLDELAVNFNIEELSEWHGNLLKRITTWRTIRQADGEAVLIWANKMQVQMIVLV